MKQSDKSKMWDILSDNSLGLLKRKNYCLKQEDGKKGFILEETEQTKRLNVMYEP